MKTNLPAFLLAITLTNCASHHSTCDSKGPVQSPCHAKGAPTWEVSDGKKLPVIAELPKPGTKIKAAVILIPGMDGTLCDYKSLTHALVQHSYAVYGCETRTGPYDPDVRHRGVACNWHLWVKDLQTTTARVRALHPTLPIYYHGHSMGAVIALETAAQSQSDNPKLVPHGLILQSPAYVMLPKKRNPLLTALMWPFSWARVNHLALMERMHSHLTQDEAWDCAWIQSENRVKKGYTIGWTLQTLKMGHKARLDSESKAMPGVLALEGEQDFITLGGHHEKGDLLAEKQEDYRKYLREELAGGNAKMLPYVKGTHLLTEGPGKNEVIHDIVAWLDGQPESSAPRR